MKLTEMRQEQIHDAVARDVPILMPSGVVEYHGPHLPIGTDFLIVKSIIDEIDRRCEAVVAPGAPLGPTGSWAAGPEDGELDFPPEPLFQYVKAELRGLLEMGFKSIYVMQHHQGTNGLQGLCWQRAAAELTLEAGRAEGAGWGRLPRDKRPQVFGRFRVLAPGAFLEGEDAKIPWGHGSIGETAYMLAICPEQVKMENLADAPEADWLANSADATAEMGRRWFELCVSSWVDALSNT